MQTCANCSTINETLPYIYFNTDSFINGDKYQLNIKSTNINANSIIANKIKVLQKTNDFVINNNINVPIFEETIVVPRISVKGTVNTIFKGDIMNRNNYFWIFDKTSKIVSLYGNILPVEDQIDDSTWLIDPQTSTIITDLPNEYTCEITPINTNQIVIDQITVNTDELPAGYVFDNIINFPNSSIKYTEGTDTIDFLDSTDNLADVKLSYNGTVNIDELQSNEIYADNITLIDEKTGFSSEIITSTGYMKIINNISGNSIEVDSTGITINGNLLVDCLFSHEIDFDNSHLKAIYLNNTSFNIEKSAIVDNS